MKSGSFNNYKYAKLYPLILAASQSKISLETLEAAHRCQDKENVQDSDGHARTYRCFCKIGRIQEVDHGLGHRRRQHWEDQQRNE